jgi:hypothetical protein
MGFIKFTEPSGEPVWIAKQWVTKVKATSKGEYAAGAKTLITMGGSSQAVTESLPDVLAMLEVPE